MDRARNLLDEFVANVAIFVAHRGAFQHRQIGGFGNVHIVGHAMPRQFDRIAELV
jgi:hypothetical protein